MLDAGWERLILDAGWWILDTGYWMERVHRGNRNMV